MSGGLGYMNNPKGALDTLELVTRQQTDLSDEPIILRRDPYRSDASTVFYFGSLRSRALELVRQAVVPGSGGRYQRIQYTTANAYARLYGKFDVADIPENVSNLVLDTFGVQSRLLLTAGGTTGSADPVTGGVVGAQPYSFPVAGTAVVTSFPMDVRGVGASGAKLADEAICEIQVSLFANTEDPAQPVPERITFPGFNATLIVTASGPTHL